MKRYNYVDSIYFTDLISKMIFFSIYLCSFSPIVLQALGFILL